MKEKIKRYPSQQALASQRMPARVYIDRKKKAKKSACRQKGDEK